jgi:hypothetical protein
MKKIACFLLIPLVMFLAACAAQPRKVINDSAISTVSEEAEVVSVPSRESVFVYGNRKNLSARLVLALTGEPVLLPSGYLRLAGVVSGERKTVCLELGGRGLALTEGEAIDDYRIVRISDNTAILEKTK